jgi:Flp pilus assembly CpaE family ATPase
MIILQLSHGLTLISLFTDQREAISEKHFQPQDSASCSHKKSYKATCLGCKGHSQAQQLAKKDSWGIDHYLHQSEIFLEDLPMRQRSMKSPFLDLGFSSSSELEELSLEKSKSLKAVHARDMIS